MSRLAQSVQRAVDEMRARRPRRRAAMDERADSEGVLEQPAAEPVADAAAPTSTEGEDTMPRATKQRKPRAAKTAPKKLRAVKPARAAKAGAVRVGKKGLLLVTTASLPLLVRAVSLLLKEGPLSDSERPVAEQLLARARSRI